MEAGTTSGMNMNMNMNMEYLRMEYLLLLPLLPF